MSISGFPDLAAARAMTRTVAELKERVSLAQEEAVTGIVADIADNGINGEELDRTKRLYRAEYIYGNDRQSTLARRYGHYWPRASDVRHGPEKDLLETPRESLERVRAWTRAADPLIAELEELAQAAEDTALLAQLQALSGDGLARLDQVARAGPVLAGRAYLLPEGGPPHALPPNVLLQRVPLDQRWFLLAVGPADG